MKFGFVLTDLSGGGAEKAILNVALGLHKRGHTVNIFLLRNLGEYAAPSEVSLTYISKKPSFSWIGKRVLAFRLSTAIKLKEKSGCFDIVISTLPLADEISKLANVPNHWCRIANTLSAEVNSIAKKNTRKSKRRFERYRRIYSSSNLIAVSSGVKEDLQRYFHLNDQLIEVIYNPFDFDLIRKKANESVNLPNEKYIIHVGRFSTQKRHDILLDAYQKKIQNLCKLVLLTDQNEILKEMIIERGLENRVIVAGFQINPYPWISNAELLVLSSDFEGMPNVLIESLVVGTPIVSTDCPSGPREILGTMFNENLVPVGDAVALSNAINFVLESSGKVFSINLDKYHSDRSIDKYEQLVKRGVECVEY